MRFGTWNVRSLYRVGAIKSVVGELEKYKLDLVEVQEVRWEGEGYQTADICMRRGEVFTEFWLESPKVRDNKKDLGVGGRITLI
jgi:exonuclease III